MALTDDERLAWLREVPLFRGGSDASLTALAARTSEVSFRAGQTIVSQGQVGNGLFAGGVDKHEALGQALREQVSPRVWPGLLQRLGEGRRVAFGALGASREGLIKGRLEGGEVLPWSDIESTTLANGKLRIKRKGKLLAWENVALGKLRNPDILLSLIQQRGIGSAAQ